MPAIDRLFFAFITAVGAISGIVLLYWPKAAETSIKPYFWVLIAMFAFDAAAFTIGRGAPGTMIATPTRLLGLLVGVVLMFAIVSAGGGKASLL